MGTEYLDKLFGIKREEETKRPVGREVRKPLIAEGSSFDEEAKRLSNELQNSDVDGILITRAKPPYSPY